MDWSLSLSSKDLLELSWKLRKVVKSFAATWRWNFLLASRWRSCRTCGLSRMNIQLKPTSPWHSSPKQILIKWTFLCSLISCSWCFWVFNKMFWICCSKNVFFFLIFQIFFSSFLFYIFFLFFNEREYWVDLRGDRQHSRCLVLSKSFLLFLFVFSIISCSTIGTFLVFVA